MADASLVIRIIADTKQAVAKLDDAAAVSGKWGSALNKGAAVGVAGLAAVSAVMIDGAKAAVEDAQQQAILAKVLQNTTHATDSQVAATEDWITAQASATGVADDQLRPALASLASATGDVGKAQDALAVALDVSAATGKDVGAVSAALAKGYSGNTGALGKLGIGIDKAVLKSGDMAKIMDQVKAKTGGAAAVAGDTAAGKFARMNNAINETKESLGAALLPAITAVVGVLGTLAKYLQDNTQVALILVGVVAALSAALIAARVITALQTTWTIALAVAHGTAAAATAVWTAAQWLLNAALTANPIGLIIVAIVAVVAALVLAYKKSETFRNIVNSAFAAVASVVSTVWNALKTFASWVGRTLAPLFRVLFGAWSVQLRAIQVVFVAVFGAIQTAVGWVISAFQTVWEWIQKLLAKLQSVPLIGKVFGGQSVPTGLSQGVTAAVPMSAPAASAGRTGGTAPVSITVVGALDPQSVGRQVARYVNGANARGGRLRLANQRLGQVVLAT